MPAGSSNRGWLQEGAIWGNMLSKQMLPGDEELGKKDDDHKPGATPRIPTWAFSNTPLRWRRRRILLAVVGLYLVYLFVHNLPDLSEWAGQRTTTQWGRPIVPTTDGEYEYDRGYDQEPTGPPPGTRAPRAGKPIPHVYSGPIKFYRLASSLHGASHTNGYRTTNRNIVFAISSLKSASTLLPMICEMSRWSRNWVHATFMGREDIEIAQILEINGIDQIKCPAIWHDARPDYTEYSTDARSESSVMAAMAHIHSFLHPQAAIIDEALSEDDFFIRGMRAKTKALAMPLIEMPKNLESFMWMTRLDAGSLRSLHHATVDILIQVPPHSSSVIRLLKSIKAADYSGLNPPHITIELPADVDDSVERYLETFKWPPSGEQSQMSIRRRIANHRATQEESAMRFLELFYPTNKNSHVLLLSPQAELSSQYYQYLMYVLLEYKYSSFGGDDAAKVMGVSLELPSVLLDGKTRLTPPKPTDMHTARYQELFPNTISVPFLWQAPNSHAALFFGDKWTELHSFLSNRVAKYSQSPKATQRHKLVSETFPSWVEYMLEYMRARGYSFFYPGVSSAESLITIHNELYQPPEEYAPPKPTTSEEEAAIPSKPLDEAFLRAEEPAPHPKNPEATVIPDSRPLHLALPFEGDLPEIPHLPYLLYKGEVIPPAKVASTASTYADKYREIIGECKIPAGKHRRVVPGSARDLFCFGDEDEDDWESDVVETFEADVVDDYKSMVSTTSVSATVGSGATETSTTMVPTTSAEAVG